MTRKSYSDKIDERGREASKANWAVMSNWASLFLAQASALGLETYPQTFRADAEGDWDTTWYFGTSASFGACTENGEVFCWAALRGQSPVGPLPGTDALKVYRTVLAATVMLS